MISFGDTYWLVWAGDCSGFTTCTYDEYLFPRFQGSSIPVDSTKQYLQQVGSSSEREKVSAVFGVHNLDQKGDDYGDDAGADDDQLCFR